jgi:hypothetical protein
MLGSYFEPQLPQGAYNWGIAQGANDKTINNHQRKVTCTITMASERNKYNSGVGTCATLYTFNLAGRPLNIIDAPGVQALMEG